MENSEDPCDMHEENNLNDNVPSTSASSSYSFHRMMGGGRAADVMLWHRRHVSFGVIVVATATWVLFELSGLPFLTICSDILLVLILLRSLRANFASMRKRPLQSLPELVLSEDMVNSAAASFRTKINYMLLMAHDISLGKDFKLFFKVCVRRVCLIVDVSMAGMRDRKVPTEIEVVFALWLLSVVGSLISFFTLAYVGVIVFITIPALYNRFQARVDGCCGMIQRNLSKHYKMVDENVISRLPRNLSREKDL